MDSCETLLARSSFACVGVVVEMAMWLGTTSLLYLHKGSFSCSRNLILVECSPAIDSVHWWKLKANHGVGNSLS